MENTLPLPYYKYSAESGVYHLSDGGLGIMFSLSPESENDDSLSYGIANLYAILPAGAHIQIINCYNSMCYITVKLGGKEYEQRLFSLKSVEDSYKEDYGKLCEISAKARLILAESALNPKACGPDELINLVTGILNSKHVKLHYTLYQDAPGRTIRDLCLEHNAVIEDRDTYALLNGVYGRSLFAKTYPGSNTSLKDFKPSAPFAYLCLNVTKLKEGDFDKFPKISGRKYEDDNKSKEFRYLLRYEQAEMERRCEQKEFMYHISYCLFLLAGSEEILDHSSDWLVSKHWEYGFRLQKNIKINVVSLLYMLPFGHDNTARLLLDRGRAFYADTVTEITKVLLRYV